MRVGENAECPVLLLYSLSHSSQSHTNLSSVCLKALQRISRNAGSVILNAHAHAFVLKVQSDFGARARRVPLNVGQALLQDTE